MAKIYVHCGQPKTGTTSIQATLRHNTTLLQEHGYLYPQTTPMPHKHTALTAAIAILSGRPVPRGIMVEANFKEARVRKIADAAVEGYYKQVAKTKPDVILISCEAMKPSEKPTIAETFKNVLASHGEELHGIMYLRNPADAYLSDFQEHLKKSSSLLQPANPKLNNAARNFFALYGRDNGHLRAYDRAQMPQGDVFKDYIRVVGASEVPFERLAKDHNTSLSAEAMVILSEEMPAVKPKNRGELGSMKKVLGAVRRSDRSIDDATRPKLRDHVRAHFDLICNDLHKLRDRHGIALPNINYARVGSDPSAEMKVENVFDIVEVNNARLVELRNEFAKQLRSA